MTTWQIALAIGVVVGVGAMCETQAVRSGGLAQKPARGWDAYQVTMWSTGEPKNLSRWWERLREIGFTAEECYRGRDAAPFVQHRFGFYVENLVPELAHLHSRRKLYDDDYKGYVATRDKRFLVRKPCFDDPAFWADVKPRLQNLVRPYVAHQPLLYNLQDELSIGSFASPMDYCFCPHTLREFRKWLQTQYASLAALNQEWETNFASWDEVAPMTTWEIKDRERAALAAGKPENYAPWADHRAFMDYSFAQALNRLRSFIRELDPTTPVGIEGTQMPSAWGGYDLWRLSQVVDWIEPYDIASSREIFRSFLPLRAPVLGTVFGSDMPRIRRNLWWLLLHGDRGCIVWDDEKSRCVEKDKDDMPLTERGKGLAPIFAELKAVAPMLLNLQRVDDRIAIHYSQASIRAHWMFDSREDKDTWHRRLSSYEASHSRFARVRDSFVRLVEDLGLQYNFVSYEQIESGELIKSGYKLLLLPQSVAMSKKECEQVEAFVRAGGTVIADSMTATMDEHCKRLPQGQLDALFGTRVSSQPRSPENRDGVASNGTPLRSVPDYKRVGKGRAVYLNINLRDYGKLRLTPPQGEEFREIFRRLFREAGIEAPVKIVGNGLRAVPCVEVVRYRGNGADYVALLRNPEFDAASFRDLGYPDNAAIEKTESAQIILPKKAQVKDARTGKSFGETDRVTVELEAWSPVILEMR
jgi:hypothetical protein